MDREMREDEEGVDRKRKGKARCGRRHGEERRGEKELSGRGEERKRRGQEKGAEERSMSEEPTSQHLMSDQHNCLLIKNIASIMHQ